MALEIKLHQKLSQSLVMTPQLQQAIKLLQLGRAEYVEVLEQELLENPILQDAREDMPVTENEGSGGGEGGESGEDGDKPGEEGFNAAAYLDLYAQAYSSQFGPARRFEGEEERSSVESLISRPEGLGSHLLWQLRTSDLNSAEREVALQVIGNLDRDGYLISTVEELEELTGATRAVVERVLSVVQTFDPPGIAARDLRECLLLQLELQGSAHSLAADIVRNHLGKLENRRFEALAKELGIALTEIQAAVRTIRQLEPRPGRPFVDEAPVYITPDIFVRKIGDDFVISLNEAGMPKLRLNPHYRELLEQNREKDSTEREYMLSRARAAAWMIKSAHQRQQTIYRVAESIMKFQREFLEHGVSALRPLVLREVAEDVGMHESTVSRVTTNKYIHTPIGVFELKFFFSSGLQSENGAVSSESVKERIREIITAEDANHPLSDHTIAEQLKAEGIDIARRTVAKYREMMNILSSSRRKAGF